MAGTPEADMKPQVLALSVRGNYHAWVLTFAPNGVGMGGTTGRLRHRAAVDMPCGRPSEVVQP
jgi:hypothetical protein